MAGPVPATRAGRVRLRLAGVGFLVVIAMLVGLTVLLYQKAFTPVVRVSLKTDSIGNQLSAPADVKLRGVEVGEVRKVTSKGDGATIELALDPAKVKLIPANVTAQLVPKTLFGEKYVLLVDPTHASTQHIAKNAVIDQDRSTTARETEKAINDLLPLLQSLQPQDLSMTLNALSTALRGRGDELGANFVAAGAYFKQLNPALPQLARDMQGLADFSNNTADATPQFLTFLDNLSANSRNLVQEQPALDTFLATTTQFSQTAQQVLARNEKQLITLASTSIPSLNILAKYSPEYPCLLQGLANYEPIVSNTFGGLTTGLHITLEPTQDNGAFVAGQEPKYRDTRPAYCSGLPHPAVPAPDFSLNDGYRTSVSPTTGVSGNSVVDPTSIANEKAAVAAVTAPVMGIPVSQVPDITTVLFGPLAVGNTAGLS